MCTSIIKGLAALGIGMTATLLLGAASPSAGVGVAQGTGMQATETQATGTQSSDRDTLVRENGQKMTGTSPGSDSNVPTTPAAGTEAAAPAAQGSHNSWHDEEAALFRLEFRKAMQRAKSDLTERETQHTSDVREIERAAAEEEHELDVLRWIRQGAIAYDAKDLPMALENLRQADLLQPRSGTLLSLLSLAYGDMGYSGKALECAQRAISQEPDGYLPLLVLGISHAHLNEFEQAIAALRAAASLEPLQRDSHFFLAECFDAMQQNDEAEKHRKLYRELEKETAPPMDTQEQSLPFGEEAQQTPPEAREQDLPSIVPPAGSETKGYPREPVRIKMQEI